MDIIIDQEVAYLAFTFVAAPDLARCTCVSSRWKEATTSTVLWGRLLRNEFRLTDIVGTDGSPVAGAREAYAHWHSWRASLDCAESVMIDAALRIRMGRSWEALRAFFARNLPAVASSLRPAVTPAHWSGLSCALRSRPSGPPLGTTLPGMVALRLLLEQCDGQEAPPPGRPWTGCIGGYGAYDHVVCVGLHSSDSIRLWTKRLAQGVEHLDDELGPFLVPIAQNYFSVDKIFFLHLVTGDVYYLNSSNRASPFALAHPPVTVPGSGLVLWLETLAARVRDGTYVASEIVTGNPATLGLCLFPQRPIGRPPGERGGGSFTIAVTRGIEVRSSCQFVPEQGQWTYSIHIRILLEGGPGALSVADRGFDTCQLLDRHWHIVPADGGDGEHVRGRGVVGQFPLLRDGGHRADVQNGHDIPDALVEGAWAAGAFVYQSCSGPTAPGAIFGGEFTFIPGTLRNPTGKPFDVEVAPFTLSIPDFIF
mmetsp:Transcript_33668/g.66535  ORF Transcript_33668/g.66535 Transcript_33668/m.66535 type:complete len:480 (+) Transcript_33668:107-1546(+)